MNFIEEFLKGQKGGNKGLFMGEGLNRISKAINGIQRGKLFGIAAAAKVGKSTFVNYGFVIGPYLYALENKINIEWIYYSLEMSRIDQEFDFAAHFMHNDYKVYNIMLPERVTYKGKNYISLSADYLTGKLQDDNSEIIKVNEEIEGYLKEVYTNRIIPLFGKWSANGILEKKGLITFVTSSDNPTGIYKGLLRHATKNGRIIMTGAEGFERPTGFVPNDPNKYTIIILDHIRKLIPERGWGKKETIDKMLQYQVILRDLLNYTFVDIVHLNRSIGSIDRLRQFGDLLHPNSDHIKDTGNIAEECNYLFTMFDPNDPRYNLTKHFGENIKDTAGNPLYPKLKSVHLVESRHCYFPQHFRVEMEGGVKSFKQLII